MQESPPARPAHMDRVGAALVSVMVLGLIVAAQAAGTDTAHAQQACPTTLDFGSLAVCSLDTLGEADNFTFAGVEGDSVRVRAIGTTPSLQPTLEIRQPDGTTLCRATASDATCRLRATGTHTVRVTATSRTGTGYYTLYLQRMNNPVGCASVSFGGSPGSGSIDVAGRVNCYTVQLQDADSVRVWASPTSGSLSSTAIEVVQPNGTTVCESGSSYPGYPGFSYSQLTCLVRASGRHTVLVYDAGSSIYPPFPYPYPTASLATGTYSLSIQRLNSPAGCVSVTYDSLLMPGSIDVTGEIDCFTFTGAAGDRVRVRAAVVTGAPPTALEVFQPDGRSLCGPSAAFPNPYGTSYGYGYPYPGTTARVGQLTCLLQASGIHTVLLGQSSLPGAGVYFYPSYPGAPAGPPVGRYNLYLQRLTNPVGCGRVSFGGAGVDGAIANTGEVDCFTLTATANDRVRVWAVGTAGLPDVDLELVQPDGTTLCGPSSLLRGSGGASGSLSCVALASGAHTLLLSQGSGVPTGPYGGPYPPPPSAGGTGSYRLYTQRLNDLVGCQPLSYSATPVTGSIDAAGELDCFTFTGAINDRARARVVADSTRLTTTVEILKPGGTACSTSPYGLRTPAPTGYGGYPYGGGPAGEALCLLEEAGPHTILVGASFSPLLGSGTGRYSLSLLRMNNPVGCATVSYGGAGASGSIDANAETDCFTVNGTTGDRIRVRLTTSSTSLTARVEVWEPSGIPLCEATFGSRTPVPLPPGYPTSYPTGADLTCSLEATGSHALLVSDSGGRGTGGYQLVVECLAGRCPPVGGRGFSLSTGTPTLRWTAGTAQQGYVIVRIGLPSGRPETLPTLSGAATSYTDSSPGSESVYCYVLVVVGAGGPIGNSDVLCGAAGSGSSTGGPRDFTIQLNESNTATLTWQPPAGGTVDGYQLQVMPLRGGTSSVTLAAGGSSGTTTHATGGAATCYELRAMRGGSAVGTTPLLCGVPGVATVGATTAAPLTSGERTSLDSAARRALETILR